MREENKGAFSESWEWAWRPSRLCVKGGCVCVGKGGGTKEAFQKALQLFFSVKSYQELVASLLGPFAFEARQHIPLQIKTLQCMSNRLAGCFFGDTAAPLAGRSGQEESAFSMFTNAIRTTNVPPNQWDPLAELGRSSKHQHSAQFLTLQVTNPP